MTTKLTEHANVPLVFCLLKLHFIIELAQRSTFFSLVEFFLEKNIPKSKILL